MGRKLNKRSSRTSSGKTKITRILRQIKRLKMKINRWNRYKEEISARTRKGKISRWDTSGLEKHIKLLESFV